MADYLNSTEVPWHDCRNDIENIVITDGVASIGGWAFTLCKNVKSVSIPVSVKSIGKGSFDTCYNLTSITIPDSVTSLGNWAFNSCTSLTSITIPNSVTSIGMYAFQDCTSLTEVTMPKSLHETLVNNGTFSDAFNGISPTFHLYESGYCGNPSVNGGKDVTWTLDDEGNLTISGNGAIKDSSFYYREDINTVVIEEGITSISRWAFDHCTSLKTITLPETLASISAYAFDGCTSLTSITIPNNVTSISPCAFYGCTSLESISMPSVTTIDGSAFKRCTSLESISMPSVTTIGITAFQGCTSLKTITLPDTLTSISNYAFEDCTNLKDVTMSKTLYDALVASNKLSTVFYDITLPSIQVRYTVDYNSNGNGTISGTTTKSFGADQIELTIQPDSNYVLDKIEWSDGTDSDVLTESNGKYTMPDTEAGAVTITATFKLIQKTVVFKNEDGTVLQSGAVDYGTNPTYTGTTPTKAEDDQYTYTFAGWSDGTKTYGPTDTLPAVTGDATYTAVFTATAKSTTPAPGTYYVQSIEEKDGAIVITIKRTENDDQTYELVQSIETDGKQLTVGDQIELTSGSAIITIKKDFVSTLTPGTHTMKVTFKDGGSITLEYTVKEPEKAAAQAVQATGEATDITAVAGVGMILTACGVVIFAKKRREET
ncbi:MAG: leucine-rich repeat domain-containing protein [Clostridiales bacterium]|nr:leucine-rich repeat domain-containing protein [Clostridiales bacterium]